MLVTSGEDVMAEDKQNGCGAKSQTVTSVRSNCQPSKAELEEDVRVDATIAAAVDALTKPVSIRYVDRAEAVD